MPIYEYRCVECGRVWEVLRRGLGESSARCPSCGGTRAEKLPSAAVLAKSATARGSTCCGREERCDRAPCSSGGECRRG